MISAQEFINTHVGNGYDPDGAYGLQCVDLWNQFCIEAGYPYPLVPGAKDIASAFDNNSCGMKDNWVEVNLANAKKGDWLIFNYNEGGGFGHVAMLVSINPNGTINIFGQNQSTSRVAVVIAYSSANVCKVLRPKCYVTNKAKPWQKEGICMYGVNDGTPVYRLYNPNNGEHFYTSDKAERDSIVKLGWKKEGVAFYMPSEGKEIYRLYNPNNGFHHFTSDNTETNKLIRAGWKLESVAWHSANSKDVPVYRAYNPNNGDHLLTCDKDEYNKL